MCDASRGWRNPPGFLARDRQRPGTGDETPLVPPAYPGRVNDETTHEGRRAGDLLVRAGAILFGIGALGTLATITPLFTGARPLPTAAYPVSMLTAVGLALALVGLVRSALEQRRQATSVDVLPSAPPDGPPPPGEVPGR
jgi:hypothetical protein